MQVTKSFKGTSITADGAAVLRFVPNTDSNYPSIKMGLTTNLGASKDRPLDTEDFLLFIETCLCDSLLSRNVSSFHVCDDLCNIVVGNQTVEIEEKELDILINLESPDSVAEIITNAPDFPSYYGLCQVLKNAIDEKGDVMEAWECSADDYDIREFVMYAIDTVYCEDTSSFEENEDSPFNPSSNYSPISNEEDSTLPFLLTPEYLFHIGLAACEASSKQEYIKFINDCKAQGYIIGKDVFPDGWADVCKYLYTDKYHVVHSTYDLKKCIADRVFSCHSLFAKKKAQ